MRLQPHAGHVNIAIFETSIIPQRSLPAAAQLAEAGQSLTSIPALNSKAGAAASLYLDFNGFTEAQWGNYSNITTPAYDQDGDPTTFSATELASIEEIWKRVSEDFAPFNINVTTVEPGSFANGVALRAAIGGNGSWFGSAGGVAYIDSFTNSIPNTVYIFSKNVNNGFAEDIADVVSHEAGHGFGLDHQSTYDANGNKTNEYNPGTSLKAPIMGNSYNAARSLWWNGTSGESSTTIQDDMTIIARAANGFGYRADDRGNTAAAATALTRWGNSVTGSGIIEKTTDLDYFSFSTAAGTVSFRLNVAEKGANLDAKIELRKATGELVASAAPTNDLGASLSASVAAGDYRLVVLSQGSYGDVGQYSISGTIVGLSAPTSPEPLTLTVASSSQINLAWTNATGETGYNVYRRIGTTTELIATLNADVTSYQSTGLTASTTYSYSVEAFNATGSTATAYKSATTLSSPVPSSPEPLTLTVISSTQIRLTWTNSTGETGYRVYQGSPTSGQVVANLGADVTTYDVTGLTPNTAYSYSVSAYNASGSISTAVKTATTFTSTPTSPEPLTATALSSTSVGLSWTNSVGETGYRVYQLVSGAYNRIATINADTVSYTVAGLTASTSYTFYIEAYNNAGVAKTAAKSVTTLTAAPTSPEPLTATALSNTSVGLSWTNSIGETGYRVYQLISGTYNQIASLNADTISYTVTGLTASTSYSFYVEAYNASGTAKTAAKSVITATGAPTSPEPLTATASSSTQINLTWKDSLNELGYRIYSWTGTGWQQAAMTAANVTSYAVTGLTGGTTYYYYVEAYNNTGTAATDWKGATTLVSAPEPLQLKVISGSQIDLTWTNVAGEEGYRVFRKTGTANWSQIVTLGADVTSYSSTGLTSGVAYSFYVEAYNTAGKAATAAKTATTLNGLPSSPEPLTATALDSSSIRLNWTDSSGETGYRVYRAAGTSWTLVTTLGANTTTYTTTGLNAASSYSFYVEAYNAVGSVKTAAKSATTTIAAPEPLLASVVSTSQVDLSWTNVAGETGYRVYQWSGSSWKQTATLGANVTTYSVKGLVANTTYYFYVDAYNSTSSNYTSYVTATTTGTPPIAPTGLTGTAVSSSSIRLTWQDTAGEDGYRIYRWTGSTWQSIATVGANVGEYTDTGLQGGRTYYYYVSAYNGSGSNGTDWIGVSLDVGAPTNFQATAVSSSRIDVSWSDVSWETGYRLYRWSGTAWQQIATLNAGTTNYSATGLSAGTTYYFYVDAYNGATNAYTDWKAATTFVASPTLTAVAVSNSQINLSWTNVTGEDGYRLHRWTGSAWEQFACVNTDTTSYSVTGLTADTTYYYYVEAHNSTSTASAAWKAATTQVAAPTSFNVTAVSSSQINLSWSDVSGESGYRVYRWSGSAWQQLATLAAGTTSYSSTSLAAGTTYYYYVEAYNSLGSSSVAWKSDSTFVATPTSFVGSGVSSSQVNLSWSNVAGESGYRLYSWTGWNWQLLASLSANTTTYSASGLNSRSTYYFYVEAYSGNSSASTNWIAATTA